jgi:hypothetical protein
VAQGAECLLLQHEALRSNHSPPTKREGLFKITKTKKGSSDSSQLASAVKPAHKKNIKHPLKK